MKVRLETVLCVCVVAFGWLLYSVWQDNPDVPDSIIETIKQEEGFRPTVYKDTRGISTIGYGFRLSEGFTEPESSLVLRERLTVRYGILKRDLPWITGRSIKTQGALLDMSWQNGVSGLLGFDEMLKALEANDCPEAKRQALDSVWGRETKGRAERVTARLCN